MTAAGVVLAGGRSSRMGRPKAGLAWHGSTLLRRVTGVVARELDGPIVVVRAPGQDLPALTPEVEVVEDPSEGRGPLQGIAAGLERVAGRAEVAFVCSTDLPFLHPAFVGRVVRALESGGDVALPHARGHRQPLAAAYRTTLAPAAAGLVAAGRLRPAFLLEGRAAVHLDGPTLLSDPRLAAFDPELESVVNLNLPADYEAAHARPEPEVTISRFGTLALRGGRGPERLRAATVARAAAGAGVPWDRHVVAALNGDRVTHDGETPLAAGDSVAFLTADAGG